MSIRVIATIGSHAPRSPNVNDDVFIILRTQGESAKLIEFAINRRDLARTLSLHASNHEVLPAVVTVFDESPELRSDQQPAEPKKVGDGELIEV